MVARDLASRGSTPSRPSRGGDVTNFLVVQAQRDLRDAQNVELRAVLDYGSRSSTSSGRSSPGPGRAVRRLGREQQQFEHQHEHELQRAKGSRDVEAVEAERSWPQWSSSLISVVSRALVARGGAWRGERGSSMTADRLGRQRTDCYEKFITVAIVILLVAPRGRGYSTREEDRSEDRHAPSPAVTSSRRSGDRHAGACRPSGRQPGWHRQGLYADSTRSSRKVSSSQDRPELIQTQIGRPGQLRRRSPTVERLKVTHAGCRRAS